MRDKKHGAKEQKQEIVINEGERRREIAKGARQENTSAGKLELS